MDPRTAQMLAEHQQAAASAPPPPRGVGRIRQDINAWVRAHRLAAAVMAVVTLVILFYAYYTLIAWPAEQRERAELEVRAVEQLKVVNAARQASLDSCLSTAKAEADTRWNQQCRVRRRSPGCPLPSRVADRLDREESQGRNACLMQFSVATQ